MQRLDSSIPLNEINVRYITMVNMTGFGERLQHAMELAGVEVRDIAKRCDLDPSSVSKWVHDDRAVSTVQAKNLYAVADYLGVCARWLATGEGVARPETAGLSFSAAKIARDLDASDPDVQLLVATLLAKLRQK